MILQLNTIRPTIDDVTGCNFLGTNLDSCEAS
jgi:hypothetical protein